MDDLARAFFDFLYDQRVAIAVVTGSALVVVALIAWRRGWFLAARRHPGRTGVLVAIAAAVGLPLTWYLASPIWVRTSLVEPAPTVAPPAPSPSVAVAVTPRPTLEPTSEPTIAPSPTPTPFTARTVATGEFEGTDEFHFGRGTASLIEVEPGRYQLRLEDFSVRNGPDLYVYLSTDANDPARDALELGRLKATDGSFGYDVPADSGIDGFRSAIIWCKQFSHLFAVATF